MLNIRIHKSHYSNLVLSQYLAFCFYTCARQLYCSLFTNKGLHRPVFTPPHNEETRTVIWGVGGHRSRMSTQTEGDETVSSVVGHVTPQGKLFGKIKYFIHLQYEEDDLELAFINYRIGYGKKVVNTQMYYIENQSVSHVNSFKPLDTLTPPLLHAWENNILWIPSRI